MRMPDSANTLLTMLCVFAPLALIFHGLTSMLCFIWFFGLIEAFILFCNLNLDGDTEHKKFIGIYLVSFVVYSVFLFTVWFTVFADPNEYYEDKDSPGYRQMMNLQNSQ